MSWFGTAKGSDSLLRAALNVCQTNVMIADENYNISYMNDTMVAMLKAAESDIRKDVPALDVNKLMGANIDTFHKNPAHQRKILDSLTKPIETDLKIGGRQFHLIVTPIFKDGTKRRMGTVVEWKDETAHKAAETVAYRLQNALDVCQTNVMVADENYDIVYMNKTMLGMMQAAEADLRKDIPALDTRKLIGSNIDAFHKNPSHQRGMLDALTKTTETHIKVGGRSFHLVVSPILDKGGKRLGMAVEWKDLTLEKSVEAEINDVVTAAAGGDLTRRIPEAGKNGFMLTLAKSINGLSSTIAGTLAEIRAAAQEVTNAAAEISVSTANLSERTEQQAASLEETSSSMEEMSSTVRKNAENAQAASRSAGETRGVADRGGQVVGKAVEAMARIDDSSRKISDIIGVIDEIARQTNLLALNAAVEAARAGEAGRGFAVVASEVRSLAQRSSQAAKDIKDLITNSNQQVQEGVELVNQAGAALQEIVESIKKVADIVSDIATASVEQAGGIEQTNKALTQMDELTQQNSALVEENAATAKTLDQQARVLDERVSFFRIDDGREPGKTPAVPLHPVSSAGHEPALPAVAAPARRTRIARRA